MRGSIRALGDQYHPVDLKTGASQSAEQVRERLEEVAQNLCEQAARADLGSKAIKALKGVYRRIEELETTVRWWHQEVERRLVALALTLPERAWVAAVLVPAMYIRRRVALGRDKEDRGRLQTLSANLWQRVQQGRPWQTWCRERRLQVLRVAEELVLHFPRSTSGVEGRNGQDSLCLHQHHQISEVFRQARASSTTTSSNEPTAPPPASASSERNPAT